jgi:hypothetical protein
MAAATLRKVAEFEIANLRAAKILLADPRYEGLPQIWAEMFLARKRGGEIIMPTSFDEGRYRVRVVNQRFCKSRVKETLGFVLDFRPLCRLDQPEVPLKSLLREVTLWITENTVKRVLHQLHQLGYAGMDLKGVDPDSENFHDFRDVDTDLTCTHEPGDKGEMYERWSFEEAKQNLSDKTLLRHFDRLLKPEPKMAVVGGDKTGITDDDVPF